MPCACAHALHSLLPCNLMQGAPLGVVSNITFQPGYWQGIPSRGRTRLEQLAQLLFLPLG
jgi:hypothetical protein